jgi:branched-chain amino acid transport system substrate-binding protein
VLRGLLALTVASSLGLGGLTACNKGGGGGAPADTILIGEYGSLTGSEATFGISTRDGIDLAIAEANLAGGVKGKKLKVIVYDNQGKQQEAATSVTRLITQDKVVAVLGEVASSRSLAGGTIAQKYKVPMITPGATSPDVTALGDYIFRVCFIDPFQARAMATFARKTLKANKVAVFRNSKDAYSVGLADFFVKSFKEQGGTITSDESYGSGDSDFKSQLTTLRTAEPDAIFIPGYYTEVGLIAKQARGLGIKVPLLGGDGWDSDKVIEIGGADIEGSYFTNHYAPDDKRPEVQKFIDAYKTKFKATPDSNAALAYDAAFLLIDAIKRAADTTPAAIRDAIAQTKDFKGVTGSISIDAERNAKKPVVVLQIKSGKFAFVEGVNP